MNMRRQDGARAPRAQSSGSAAFVDMLRAALLAVALAVSAGVAGAGETVDLRLRLPAGYKRTVTMITEQHIEQTMQGETVAMDQTLGVGFDVEVLQVDDQGLMTLRYTYSWTKITQQGPQGMVQYNSDTPPETVPPRARPFAALLGASFETDLTPRGEVRALRGAEALIDHVLEALEVPEGPARTRVRENLRNLFGGEGLRKRLEVMTAAYPEEPVAVGDSWTRVTDLTVGFPTRMRNTWTLERVEDGLAVLTVDSEYLAPDEDAQAGPPELSIQPTDLRGSVEAVYTMPLNTGWTQAARITQDMTMTMQSAQQSWPLSVTGTTKLEATPGP